MLRRMAWWGWVLIAWVASAAPLGLFLGAVAIKARTIRAAEEERAERLVQIAA